MKLDKLKNIKIFYCEIHAVIHDMDMYKALKLCIVILSIFLQLLGILCLLDTTCNQFKKFEFIYNTKSIFLYNVHLLT